MRPTKLTARGYVLRKTDMTADEIAMVRKDLLVTPVNPVRDKMLKERQRWDPTATDDADDSFKVYRENEAKFYLPPFYAIDRFGPPTTNHSTLR